MNLIQRIRELRKLSLMQSYYDGRIKENMKRAISILDKGTPTDKYAELVRELWKHNIEMSYELIRIREKIALHEIAIRPVKIFGFSMLFILICIALVVCTKN